MTIEQEMQEYIQSHMQNGQWEGDVEQHQAKVRRYKQAVEEEKQERAVKLYQAGRELNEIMSTEVVADFMKYWPLFSRREASRMSCNDGNLFSPIIPEEQVVIYRFCNCGQFPKNPIKMSNTERIFANEHLATCTNIREDKQVEMSMVPQHKVGQWDCRACYRGYDGQSSIDWCPRFLRPFRQLSVQEYAKAVNTASKSTVVCYAGLLHVQLSVKQVGEKDYIIRTEACDTCGYRHETQEEVAMSPAEQRKNV